MIPLMALWLALGEQPVRAQLAPVKLPAAAGTTQAPARIAAGTFTALEKHFNQRLSTLFDATDPLDLLGNTRGVYVDDFGVVFTSEVSLVVTPTVNPFRPKITKETADAVRAKKMQRLPILKAAMKEMMAKMAATFMQLPPERQMVLVVRFYYEPWEDMNGMPSQVMMRADRRGAATGNIQVEEQ